MILTSDGNYTVMITELKDGLKEFLNNNQEKNIYRLFDELYNVITSSINIQKRNHNYIIIYKF